MDRTSGDERVCNDNLHWNAGLLCKKRLGNLRDRRYIPEIYAGHVWIVIGQCSDGSVVVIHATPPYIQLGGTVSSTGSINSEAIELANEYMKMYYPVAYERYGVKVLDRSYLTGVNHFTWSSSILSDSEGYRRKKPAEILNDLFQ